MFKIGDKVTFTERALFELAGVDREVHLVTNILPSFLDSSRTVVEVNGHLFDPFFLMLVQDPPPRIKLLKVWRVK